MSRMLCGYELGDRVSFLHDGDRLTGIVVRVYNTRFNYHVEVLALSVRYWFKFKKGKRKND